MKKVQIKPFKPKSPAEFQLIQLIQAMFERILGDGFNEWHQWKHTIGQKGECPNSSPFIPFLREWVKADKKARQPIVTAGFQAYINNIDPYTVVKVVKVKRPSKNV